MIGASFYCVPRPQDRRSRKLGAVRAYSGWNGYLLLILPWANFGSFCWPVLWSSATLEHVGAVEPAERALRSCRPPDPPLTHRSEYMYAGRPFHESALIPAEPAVIGCVRAGANPSATRANVRAARQIRRPATPLFAFGRSACPGKNRTLSQGQKVRRRIITPELPPLPTAKKI